MTRPADEARRAVEAHATAINDRDPTGYRRATSFPFTYQNADGVALTIETAADLGAVAPYPWDIILKTDPHWHSTTFDSIDEVASSKTAVAFRVRFRRLDSDGGTSPAYAAIWIATRRRGEGAARWGVQLRHNLGLVDDG